MASAHNRFGSSLLIWTAAACVLASGLLATWGSREVTLASQDTQRLEASNGALQTGLAELAAAESARRAYSLTGDPTAPSAARAAAERALSLFAETALPGSPAGRRARAELLRSAARRVGHLRASLAAPREPGFDEVRTTTEGVRLMAEVRAAADATVREQARELAATYAAGRRSARLAAVAALAGTLLAAVTLASATRMLRRERRARRVAERTARESDARLQQLVDASPAAVFAKDREGRFVVANREVARILGRPAAEILGQTVRELVPASAAAEFDTNDRRALAGEVVEIEERLPRPDGGERVFLAVKFPLRDPEGEIVGVGGVSTDITGRVARDQELARLHRDLEARMAETDAVNQELEAFSYSVSHDLRAPLRHLSGFVDLLRPRLAAVADPKVEHYLDTIASAAAQMGRLIDDLLAFSRTGRTPLVVRPVALAPLVRELSHQLEERAGGRAIEWEIGELPEVRGDRGLLAVALGNVLDNAVKYTRPRTPARIEIVAECDGEGLVAIRVRDNGVGFDMAYAAKLFGVFQRLHRADEFEGTGIGLATVRRIVHRHGGSVRAEGEPEVGAVVHLTLPLALKEVS